MEESGRQRGKSAGSNSTIRACCIDSDCGLKVFPFTLKVALCGLTVALGSMTDPWCHMDTASFSSTEPSLFVYNDFYLFKFHYLLFMYAEAPCLSEYTLHISVFR